MSILKNFEAKVLKQEGCWLWQAAKTKQGYGQFGYKGMMRGAHRVAFELYIAEIPKDMHVLHMCDNPGCVNPAHLYLGTNADNIRERKSKNRTYAPTGTAHHNAVFTEATLEQLKVMYATGDYTHRALAFKFGVGKTTITQALKGATYAK